jgi:hypothetical protein
MRIRMAALIGMCLASWSSAASAQPAEAVPSQLAAAPTPSDVIAAPAPYTLPFGLRGAAAVTAVRAETAYGWNAGQSSTGVQYLIASYAPLKNFSLGVRGGWVDYIPEKGNSSTAFTNIALAGVWADTVAPSVRVEGAVGLGLPVGQGGGNAPDLGQAAAMAAANLARSRFEGLTMFKPNDLTPYLGGDVAWVSGGVTLQAEATVFQGFRVRGGAPSDPDSAITSLTMGADAGYAILPELSVALEVRDQTFLSTPAAVDAGKTSRTWVTVGGGPRANVHLSNDVVLRPALAYFQPLNDPSPTISASSYHIFLLDIVLVL